MYIYLFEFNCIYALFCLNFLFVFFPPFFYNNALEL